MKKFYFSTLILILSIYFDYNYGYLSFEISNQITIILQDNFEYGDFQGEIEQLFYVFSILGDRNVMNYILIFLWVKQANKLSTLSLIMMYSISQFCGDFIKMLLKQPRPFYINNKVKLDFCIYGYGGPSGHACRALVFYVILSRILQNKQNNKQLDFHSITTDEQNLVILSDQQQQKNSNWINSSIRNTILICVVFLTGSARVFFGVHFLNQVLLGWIIGMYLLFIYYYCGLEDKINQLLNQAIKKEPVISESIILMIYLFLTITASFTIYQNCINSQILNQLKENWKSITDLQQKCDENEKNFNESFEKQDLIGTSIIAFPYFIFLCIINKKGSYQPQLYKNNFFTKKGIIRIMILTLALMLLYYCRKYTKQFLIKNNNNIVIQFIFIGLLYFLGLSLLIIYLIPSIQKLLKVENPGDLMCYNPNNNIETYELEL